MRFIPRSDPRSGPGRSGGRRWFFLFCLGIASLIGPAGQGGSGKTIGPASAFAREMTPELQYESLRLPVSNFGFRGIAEDRRGALYVASSLRNGLYVLPAGCRNESCATLIPLSPALGLPGEVVADPDRGGAYVLLRLGDRLAYLPPGCLSESCLEPVLLPERPSYPSRAVYDGRRHALAVLDRLSGRIVFVPAGCGGRRCLAFLALSPRGDPSGIAYDGKRGDLWVTLARTGSLIRVPAGCRKASCTVVFPSTIPDLDPRSPVVSASEDRLYLILAGGKKIGWIDLSEGKPALRMRSIETTSGTIVLLAPRPSGGILLATGGDHPHVGTFAVGGSCPQGCFDLRLLPFGNGSPYGFSPGRHGSVWMTVNDRDGLFRILSRSSCFSGVKAKALVLSGPCFGKIAFQKIETIYHSRYHQEIQVPSEPSTNLSKPSD